MPTYWVSVLLKTVRTRYTHSLRSCVSLGSIKNAPEGRVGGVGVWFHHLLVYTVHVLVYTGFPELIANYLNLVSI